MPAAKPLALIAGLSLAASLSAAQTPAPALRPFPPQPYAPPTTPLGTGPYKAIMETYAEFPEHVVYRPASVAKAGKLPVLAWANGGCHPAGNRFRYFLTEIASHGYLVVSAGIMGDKAVEVGPTENPDIPDPADPDRLNDPTRQRPPQPETYAKPAEPGRATPQHLVAALTWAERENERVGSPLFHRIDTARMAVGGQSCGGVVALRASADPRVKTSLIFSPATGPENEAMGRIHAPIAFITGDLQRDSAYARIPFRMNAINGVLAFRATRDGVAHIGTYGAANGGEFAQVGRDWLDWQLKGDQTAARTFRGAECGLCVRAGWHVYKKGFD